MREKLLKLVLIIGLVVFFAVSAFVACSKSPQLEFDVWELGMHIEKVKQIAEKEKIPICELKDRKDTVFIYNDTLFEESATVLLLFTPKTQKLYRITIVWDNPEVFSELHRRLRKQYARFGEFEKCAKERYSWNIYNYSIWKWFCEPFGVVALARERDRVDLEYKNLLLLKIAEKERLQTE